MNEELNRYPLTPDKCYRPVYDIRNSDFAKMLSGDKTVTENTPNHPGKDESEFKVMFDKGWSGDTKGLAYIIESQPSNEPTEADIFSAEFNAIWEVIKKWDIDRGNYGTTNRNNYSTATGTDVMMILNALKTIK